MRNENCTHTENKTCGFCEVVRESQLIRKDLLLDGDVCDTPQMKRSIDEQMDRYAELEAQKCQNVECDNIGSKITAITNTNGVRQVEEIYLCQSCQDAVNLQESKA